MPSTPSSSSEEKITSGEQHEEDNSWPSDHHGRGTEEEVEVEEVDEEVAKLAELFRATNSLRAADPSAPHVNTDTDYHSPCDGCLKPFAGTKQCGRCESVFYCGRDCQASHWSAEHKAECRQLKKRNEETARRALEGFVGFRDGWRSLDAPGVYKAAVRQGLHDKIRGVMELDEAYIVDRYKDDRGAFICYTHCVMSVLFRGRPAEVTEGAESLPFNCFDGLRIRDYVTSHPEALDAWLQGSVQLIRAVLDPTTLLREPRHHRLAHISAGEVWSGWVRVIMNTTAARAILLPFPTPMGDDGDSAEQRRQRGENHARRIVQTLADAYREAVRLYESVSDDPRVESGSLLNVENAVSSVGAMILARTKEYGISIDVEGILDLKGQAKLFFHHHAIPLANSTIEKGGPLNAQETKALMAVAIRRMGLR